MSTVTSPATVAVSDDHLVVAAAVVEPVVVTFDGLYVWSFVPRRDGDRTRHGWRVRWPSAIRARLDGTTCVRLADAAGQRVYFEGAVSFRDNPDPLRLCDPQGHPLAL